MFHNIPYILKRVVSVVRLPFQLQTAPTKKHITNLLTHVAKGSKTSIDMKNNKDCNVINVYIDLQNKQLIVLRWKGVQ